MCLSALFPAIRSEVRGTASLPWSCSAGWRQMGLINCEFIRAFCCGMLLTASLTSLPSMLLFCFLDCFATSWRGAMHCPVRSAATYLGVRTPVATLHQRGKDLGMRYQARGVDSAKGISVFLLGSDPSCLFPPDFNSVALNLLHVCVIRHVGPHSRTLFHRTQKRSPLRRARIRTGVRCCSAHRDWRCPGIAKRPGVEGRLQLSP